MWVLDLSLVEEPGNAGADVLEVRRGPALYKVRARAPPGLTTYKRAGGLSIKHTPETMATITPELMQRLMTHLGASKPEELEERARAQAMVLDEEIKKNATAAAKLSLLEQQRDDRVALERAKLEQTIAKQIEPKFADIVAEGAVGSIDESVASGALRRGGG